MKKVLFAITSLGAGGAEKVLADLVTHIDKNKYELHVFSIYNEGVYIPVVKENAQFHYGITLNEHTNLVAKIINRLKIAFVRHAPSKLLYLLFIGRTKYDVEIAFLEGWSTKLISSSTNQSRKIAWIHTDMVNNPHADSAYKNNDEHQQAYEKFDHVVCVAAETKSRFLAKFPGIKCDVSICKNPIDIASIQKRSLENIPAGWKKNTINILAVGRLVKVKGFERLIEACTVLSENNINFHLNIVGDGELRQQLQEQAKVLIDKGLFTLWGYQENPYIFIKNADICVSSSYTEGAPVFLCESLALQKLIIATECPGSLDVLNDGKYGIVCDNSVAGLTNALYDVLTDIKKYKIKFLEWYPESICEYQVDYVIDTIMNKYMG